MLNILSFLIKAASENIVLKMISEQYFKNAILFPTLVN